MSEWSHLEGLERKVPKPAIDDPIDGMPIHILSVPGPLPPVPDRNAGSIVPARTIATPLPQIPNRLIQVGKGAVDQSDAQILEPEEKTSNQIPGVHPEIGADASGLDQEFYEQRITTEEQ